MGLRESGRGGPSRASVGEYAGVGLQFAGAILLFLFLGRWMDGRLGTDPWLTVAGVVVGATAGFYAMYRQLVLAPKEQKERERGR